jgi:hypothetical protein
MPEIQLKHGGTTQVSPEDFDFLNQFEWKLGKNGYVYTTLYMHRLVAKTPPHLVADHKDRKRTNNQRDNLRNVTHKVNAANRSLEKLSRNKVGNPPSSKYRGVSKVGDQWRAVGYVNRRQIHLGYFPTEELAFAARKAYVEQHGHVGI